MTGSIPSVYPRSRRLRSLGMLFIVALCASLSPLTYAQDTSAQRMAAEQVKLSQQFVQQRIEKLKLGIVRIEAEMDSKELGTGIVLSATPQRILILTALHVVRDARSIAVTFYSDQSQPFVARRLSKFSSALDLAIIEVQSSSSVKLPSDLTTYNFAANNTFVTTQHIYSVNGDWTVVGNNITKLSHDGDPQKFEYSNVSVGRGFSGGPVFDDYGDIIGMHDALSPDGSYAVAIKIDSALQVLEALDYKVSKAGPVVMPDYSALYKAGRASVPEVAATSAPPFGGNLGASAPPAPDDPCSNRCETTLSALKHIHDFAGTSRPGASCRESVFSFPPSWPDSDRFMHITYCLAGTGSLSQFIVRFAATDRQGDSDTQYGMGIMTGSTGQGQIRGQNRKYWRLSFRNPNFGGNFNLGAVSIAVEPFTLHR